MMNLHRALGTVEEAVLAAAEEPWGASDDAPGDSPWARRARHERRVQAASMPLSICWRGGQEIPYEERVAVALMLWAWAQEVHPYAPGAQAPTESTLVPGVRRQSRHGGALCAAAREAADRFLRGTDASDWRGRTAGLVRVAETLIDAELLPQAQELLAAALDSIHAISPPLRPVVEPAEQAWKSLVEAQEAAERAEAQEADSA